MLDGSGKTNLVLQTCKHSKENGIIHLQPGIIYIQYPVSGTKEDFIATCREALDLPYFPKFMNGVFNLLLKGMLED